jgi:hypothetical protein
MFPSDNVLGFSGESARRTKSTIHSVSFSKKAQNHTHMMAIYIMHFNFVRMHKMLKVSPAVAAYVTSKPWEMSDMVKVLEDWETTNA